MILPRCFALAIAIAVIGANAGQGAELPTQSAQNKKPKAAEPVKHCNIAGSPGILAANDVCVRFSGFISTGVTAGQIK